MTVERPRLLIVTGETGQFRYYAEVARRLQRQGLEVGFCCDRDDPGVTETISSAAANLGTPFFKHEGDREPGVFSFRDEIFWRLHQRRHRDNSYDGISDALLQAMRRYHFYRLRGAERILRKYRPDVIVLGEDGIAIDLWAIIAARKLGIKVAVLPYGMGDSSSLLWKGVEQKAREGALITVDSPGGAAVKALHPKWIKQTSYGEVMFLPPAYIVALEEIGVKLRDPWCFQGGDADILLIEGPTARKHYLSEGVPAEKLRDVGSIYCDVLHDQFRPDSLAAFEQCRSRRPGAYNVLFCVPPSESPSWSARSEFQSLGATISRFSERMKAMPNFQVTYSFHPRMLPVDRQVLIENGILEDSRFVVEQIPDCDILVACGSSVSRWAIAARKLVLDIDVYGFGINDYPHIPSFLHANNLAEFQAIIGSLGQDPGLYSKLVRSSTQFASDMGTVDGLSAVRIAGELRSLLKAR